MDPFCVLWVGRGSRIRQIDRTSICTHPSAYCVVMPQRRTAANGAKEQFVRGYGTK